MKILFYIFAILSVYFLLAVIKIIFIDMDRLTEWGWGYLAGEGVLLAVFILLTVITFRKAYSEETN